MQQVLLECICTFDVLNWHKNMEVILKVEQKDKSDI